MAPAADKPRPYDLVSCVNHFGVVFGGHYTACGRSLQDPSWLHFDDDNIALTTSICRPCAYVLVYRQQDASRAAQ